MKPSFYEKLIFLSKKTLSIFIEHNEHKIIYQKLEDYLKENDIEMDEEIKKICLEKNDFWRLNVYPFTPIACIEFCGMSLDFIIDKAYEACRNNFKDYYDPKDKEKQNGI